MSWKLEKALGPKNHGGCAPVTPTAVGMGHREAGTGTTPGSKEFQKAEKCLGTEFNESQVLPATEGQWSQEIPLVPAFCIPIAPGSRHSS